MTATVIVAAVFTACALVSASYLLAHAQLTARSFDRRPDWYRPHRPRPWLESARRFPPAPILVVLVSMSLVGATTGSGAWPADQTAASSAPSPTLQPLIAAASHSPLPSSCVSSPSCSEMVAAPAGWRLTVFRNFPMAGSSAVTQAVVVVHGTGRNAQGYFSSVMAAATQSGVADRTIVIAPWFKTSQDSPNEREATWTSGAWKIGAGAESPSGLSSFLVMDQIIATLASKKRFPNLTNITITGHSAGGQFTQRYAAFGLAPNALPGVSVRYVPANPSSYVYFTPTRPNGGDSASCADYDTYKYGMQGRTGYPGKLTPAQALLNYTSRQVTIVNGGADTFDNGDMDSDCGAMMQGPNRATRGANFIQYIHTIAPITETRQTRIVVPGVDHDGDVIFNDPAVRAALFSTSTTLRTSHTESSSSISVTNPSRGGEQ